MPTSTTADYKTQLAALVNARDSAAQAGRFESVAVYDERIDETLGRLSRQMAKERATSTTADVER